MTVFAYLQFLVIITSTLYLLRLLCRMGKKTSEPTSWPLIGMLPVVIHKLFQGKAHDYLTEVLIQCGGTYKLKCPCTELVFTSDPSNIHHVLSKNFSNYPKGPEFRKIFEIFGDGLIRADFEVWQIQRKTTQMFFTHADFYTSLEAIVWDKVESALLPVLDHFCDKGSDLDLQDILQRYTFDTISKLLFDYDPCSLSNELPYVPCERAFSSLDQPLMLRHIIPETIWKLQKWLRISGEKTILDCWKAFDEFIYSHIGLQNEYCSFLKTYEKVYQENNMGSSPRVFLRDTALTLMFAGRDTTSTCLTWFFWLISRNPSVENKIRREIETLIADEDGKSWRHFNVEDSRKLVYLHGALCESLRLYPPVSMEHKAPIKPDVLPSGHCLPKNSKLILSFYSVGRMESVWGKDCLEFKPERWITEDGGIKREPSYKFPAFNAGPRTCIGKEMAFIQMKMVAAAIICRYKIQLVKGHPVYPRLSIILQARHGLKVVLSRRNG